MTTPALVVAVSGGGSNLQAIIDAIAAVIKRVDPEAWK